MTIEMIEFFTSGFASIPYDIIKWGKGLLWAELKKKQCLTPVGQVIYDLIEKIVNEKTGNQLSLDKIAPVCEMIFFEYTQKNKFTIDGIKKAINVLGKNYTLEDAELWKQDLDEQISRTDIPYKYMLKRQSDSHGDGLEKICSEISQLREALRRSEVRKSFSKEIVFKAIKDALNRQFLLADNYSLDLYPIDPGMFTDLYEKENKKNYTANENNTSLIQKIEEMTIGELHEDCGMLLVTGEGGIGKTVTFLCTAEQLCIENKIAIYVPLRRIKVNVSLEEFIDNEILRASNLSFDAVWKFCNEECDHSTLYLFLDGFNELKQNLKYRLLEEIRQWRSYGNIIVIVSSRRTFEEEGCQENHYQRLCMKRLAWERVVQYLQSKNIQIPDQEKMSEILGIPLMLKIFAVVKSNEKGVESLSRGCSRWRKDLTSSGNLLWDYVQCQIYNTNYKVNKNDDSYMNIITAAEYIAPYLAARMNVQGTYIIEDVVIINWIEQGLRMLEESRSFQRRKMQIALKYQEKSFFEETAKSKDILELLTNRLNILRLYDEEDGCLFSFEHQDFQDIFHYIYIEASFEYYKETFYQGAFNHKPLPFDLVTRMCEMMDEEQIGKLWQDLHDFPERQGEYGITNIVEVLKRKRNNDLSCIDFTGLDLKNTKLSGVVLSQKNNKACFKKTKIATGTFSSEGHSAAVDSISFNNTGTKFVSASYDKLLRIWNTYDGKRLADLEGHIHYVRSVAWSPDGKTIISGGDDQKLFVWDAYAKLERKEDRHQILEEHKGWIYSVNWAYNSRQFASGDSTGTICIWNYKYGSGAVLYKKIHSHKCAVKELIWSPMNKNVFASCSSDGEIKLWEAEKEVFSFKEDAEGATTLGWSPDGKMLAVGFGNVLYIWNIALNKKDKKVSVVEKIEIFDQTITRIIWSDNFIAFVSDKKIGILFLKGIYDKNQIWYKKTRYSVNIILGHKSPIQALSWSEQEKKLITGADDSSIYIWKARNPSWNNDWNCVCAIEGTSLPVRCVAWSETSEEIVAGYDDNVLRKWNIAEERCTGIFRGHDNRVKCVDWLGNHIASGSNDAYVRIWNTETEECINFMDLHKGAVNCIKWFSDGKRVVSGSDDSTLIIWNYVTDEKIQLKGHNDKVNCVTLSPDEQILASGSSDRTIRFWNAQTGEQLKEMNIISEDGVGHKAQIRDIAWSHYKNFPVIVSGSCDKTLICWKQEENKKWKQKCVLNGHDDFVYCVSWNPKSTFLVSGSTDNTLWIWNVETEEKMYRMTEHTNYAHGVSWSPNGNYIASASCDGSIIIWDVKKISKVTPIHKLIAINAVDIRDCNFKEAEFETEKLKKLIQMNGGYTM